MKKLTIASLFALIGTTLLIAQFRGGERPEPNYDELIAFLGLSDTQVDCLQSNQDGLRDALAPTQEQVRDLQMQLRQATRNNEDTAAIQAEIDSVRAAAAATKTSFVSTAQSCLNSDQSGPLSDLVAAETLANEVRQGTRLSLLQSTEEGAPPQAGASRRGKRGPGRSRTGSR